MIDAYASLRHYQEHLAPVWAALPAELRGTMWSPSRTEPWGTPLGPARNTARLVLVASARDAQAMAPSPLVYLEHGAGQTYTGDPRAEADTAYAGGRGHERVRLFLCPNQVVADRWQAAYARTRVAVVGCPKLDRWHLREQQQEHDQHQDDEHERGGRHGGDRTHRPVVAVTFHWDCGLVPETRSAWRHYDRSLPALAADPRWELLGHGHPRLWATIRRRWEQLAVPHTGELAEVLDRADVLVGDNSSALYEFASLGRPVVCINMPGYRRHVEHGLRFWTHPPGLQADTPTQLPEVLARAIEDPPAARAMRARAVARAYAHTDGRAAERAAAAIMELHRDAQARR